MSVSAYAASSTTTITVSPTSLNLLPGSQARLIVENIGPVLAENIKVSISAGLLNYVDVKSDCLASLRPGVPCSLMVKVMSGSYRASGDLGISGSNTNTVVVHVKIN